MSDVRTRRAAGKLGHHHAVATPYQRSHVAVPGGARQQQVRRPSAPPAARGGGVPPLPPPRLKGPGPPPVPKGFLLPSRLPPPLPAPALFDASGGRHALSVLHARSLSPPRAADMVGMMRGSEGTGLAALMLPHGPAAPPPPRDTLPVVYVGPRRPPTPPPRSLARDDLSVPGGSGSSMASGAVDRGDLLEAIRGGGMPLRPVGERKFIVLPDAPVPQMTLAQQMENEMRKRRAALREKEEDAANAALREAGADNWDV